MSSLRCLFQIAFFPLVLACGESDQDDAQDGNTNGVLPEAGVLVTGQLSTEVSADSAHAFQMNDGVASPDGVTATVTSGVLSISTGGSSLTQDDENFVSSIIAVYEQKSSRFESAPTFQFVNMRTTSGENLLTIPIADAKDGAIELGDIAESEGELIGSRSAEDELNTPTEDIIALATIDETLRSVKNDWINANDDGVILKPDVGLYFFSSLSNGLGEFSTANWTYGGFQPQFKDVEHPDISVATICDASSSSYKSLVLTPPATITSYSDPSQTFDSLTNANPTMNNDGSCGAGEIYFAEENGRAFFNYGGRPAYGGVPPEGLWDLTIDDTLIGRFDMAAANPVNENGKIRTFVPSVRVTTESGTDKVLSIEVKFQIYHAGSGSYEDLTDYSLMASTVASAGFDILGSAGTNSNTSPDQMTNVQSPHYGKDTEAYTAFPADGSPLILEGEGLGGDWYLAPSGNDTNSNRILRKVTVGYQIAGNSFSFDFQGLGFESN